VISLFHVAKQYANQHTALSNISLTIGSQEMVFLLGHSGAGKSTLLKLISLLERPSRGQIQVAGQKLEQISKNKIPYYRRRIGLITQDPKLLQQYSVFENVAMPLIISGFEQIDIVKRVRAALKKVGLLHKERVKPGSLSDGERQRVNIARAVVHKPMLLLADEPTGNLDPELSMEILNLFESFNQVGVTVIIATHDISLIEQLPYRRIMLSQGTIVSDQTPDLIIERKSQNA
jgi:cell division transport system ATP-binding protein